MTTLLSLTFSIPSEGARISLPLDALNHSILDMTFDIDWGDGFCSKNISFSCSCIDLFSHRYKTRGQFTLVIIENTGTGDLKFGSPLWKGADYIVSVGKYISPRFKSLSYMFSGAYDFNDPNVKYWDTSNVKDMSFMFHCTNLFNQPIGCWDTSNVINMSGMFCKTMMFNKPLEKWNTSKVRNMAKMFCCAESFDRDISAWDTSNVIIMTRMFYNATNFDQPIGCWNTSSVISMAYIFAGAKSFSYDVREWDTSKLVDSLESLESLDIDF